MNFFEVLRGRYGTECIKTLRSIEQLERKTARQRNHLRFNLRCRDERVVPRSLNIKNPIPTANARRMVERVRMALVNERIRCTTNRISNLELELKRGRDKFIRAYTLEQEMEEKLDTHLKNIHEYEFIKTKARHVKKINTLIKERDRTTHTHTSPTDKWVRNLSGHQLSKAEESILARGLNFAVTPKRIPTEEFILATELACDHITDPGGKAALRNEVAGILRTAKLPPDNITHDERAAIRTLGKNRDLTILPADKGRTTVVMDATLYNTQMTTMLADAQTYELLTKDPTEDKKNKLKKLLRPLLDKGQIDKKTYNHLIPTASITPRIYGTPKIHKPDIPLRPIVDSIGSVTYNLSKTLADILKPLLGQTHYHCKNSKQLAHELKDLTFDKDEILISHDVVSLFTKTPVDATLNVVHDRLTLDRTLKKTDKTHDC